jgi:Uncharacterized protein conserved in bacteria
VHLFRRPEQKSKSIHYLNMLNTFSRKLMQLYFISHYINESNDTSLINIIYFIMCYKACVRAKVSLFRAGQLVNRNQKSKYTKEAKEHFKLARKYMKMF